MHDCRGLDLAPRNGEQTAAAGALILFPLTWTGCACVCGSQKILIGHIMFLQSCFLQISRLQLSNLHNPTYTVWRNMCAERLSLVHA